MPHEWNNTLVVTKDEIMPWYNCEATIRQDITRGKIKKVQSGGNGRQMLIAYDSLPNEIQNAIPDPRKHGHIMELFYRTDAEAVRFYQEYQFEDGSYLSDTHQEQYITNASVLKAVLQMRIAAIKEIKSKNKSPKNLWKRLLNDCTTFNATLNVKHQVRHNLPESEKRFKPALIRFEKDGYKSLISKKHKNTNSKKVTDEIIELLNNLFAKQFHKPTRTEVSRQYEGFLDGYIEVINPETGECYDPKNFKSLSDGTVIGWLNKWEHKIGTLAARSGNRQKLIGQFTPHHSFLQPKSAGSIISIDDRQPPFTYGNHKRVWCYTGIDLGSEFFVAAVFGHTKEGIILDFYRELVRNCCAWGLNLPAELEGEMSLNSAYLNTFLREGNMFEFTHIEANNARGKRVEAYFRPLRYEVEKKRMGWLARPHALSESNQMGAEKVPEIPYNDIVRNAKEDLRTWNNMPHSKHPEMSRYEYHIKFQNQKLLPINWKGFLPYIGFRTLTSCNAGIIRLNNQECLLGDKGVLFTGDKLIQLMTRVEGESIDVCWVDDHNNNVLKALIYIGDTYMGEAIPKPVYQKARKERTDEDVANQQLMSSYVATINAYMREQKNNLERLTLIDNRVFTVNDNFRFPGDEEPSTPIKESGALITEPTDEFEHIEAAPQAKSIKDRF